MALFQAERVYLVLALVFGGGFLVLTPPFQAPDEEAHFRRAYSLSEGRAVCIKRGNESGDLQPRGLSAYCAPYAGIAYHAEQKSSFATIRASADTSFDADNREFVAFSNAAMHPPLVYVPQASGIFAARLCSSSVLVAFYAGRVANLLAATALTYLAIRLAPMGKWAFACFALTPITLFLTASFSSDALTNAFSFLLIAQVLAAATGPAERVSNRALAGLAVNGVAIALAKQAYFLLPLCYLMIPVARLGGPLRYVSGLVLVMGATLAAVAGWGQVVRGIYSPADITKGINPGDQLHLMLTDPVGFARVVFWSMGWAGLWAEEYVGWLGQLDTSLPRWLLMAEYMLLAVLCVREFDRRSGLTARQALVAGAVACLVSFTLLVVIHATWDAVGASVVVLQGRYFIPIGPLVGMVFGRAVGSAPYRWPKLSLAVPVALVLVVPVLLAVAVARVHDRFFVDSPRAAADRLFVRAKALDAKIECRNEGRALLEEALRLCPDHVPSHFVLGQYLLDTNPSEALEHFRAIERDSPTDVEALCKLADVLARGAEYDEAVRLYREANRLAPRDEKIKQDLARARQAREGLAQGLRQMSEILPRLAAASGLVETRYKGTSKEGTFLLPNRGRIVNAAGQDPFGQEFVWRWPPPSGDEVALARSNGAATESSPRVPFYACSAIRGSRRVFVFPPPRSAVVQPDAAMSWFYQVPLSELTAVERQREQEYRHHLGLSFPLTKLPE
jgi:uncharacterized membrane protein